MTKQAGLGFDMTSGSLYANARLSKKTRVGTVAKPELGTKRLCGGCGAKYYDLNRDPITCPKCGTVFVLSQAMRVKAAAKAAAVEEDEDDDVEAEDDGAELVSLEEADAETEGDAAVSVDADDDEEDIDDDDSVDDVFIDDEDEEDDEVPGIVVERDDEDTDR
ncbi:TIGR02300 family protein [Stappia sp.]|uniref:TIGR02300 family protein n=1 Tax=Stappia sp. TaxID=1870903 RepID=UPI003A99B808